MGMIVNDKQVRMGFDVLIAVKMTMTDFGL
jgi:hypothetical protein